jgi:hypothetical protein
MQSEMACTRVYAIYACVECLVQFLLVQFNVSSFGYICNVFLTFRNRGVLKGFLNNNEKYLLH